jgi:hypothetical protein
LSDTANNKNPDPDITQAKADILRAHDIMPPYDKPSSPKPEPEDQSDIPTFNLADKILANQRKVASAKRKSPAKPTPPIPIVEYKPVTPAPARTPQPDSVIARIVARDIERLRQFGC